MSGPMAGYPLHLALPTIPATSPTLAEAMRTCLLRAGLSKTAGISAYVLGNPKAWLGTAYHGVLEQLPALAGMDTLGTLLQLWEEQIERLKQSAAAHPLNRRYGPAQSWH